MKGIVQGVGFRPFVYKLAQRLNLAGYVRNDSSGLIAEVEGPEAAVEAFLEALGSEHPPLAWIQDRAVTSLPLNGDREFRIRPSVAETGRFALVSPDVATCADCLADFTDPANRRYGYAFTNCTNCGPRYTIIRDIPYDRPNTTMAAFDMCAACRRSTTIRRTGAFTRSRTRARRAGRRSRRRSAEAQRRLAEGEIVAIKGLGGFHLACDARNRAAVERLRARKRRSDKPFALMARDLAAARELCVVDDAAARALSGPRHAIVILPRRADAELPEAIAPGNPTLGVMLPYTPLHHLLFAGGAIHGAGDDQRQPERGADRGGQRGCARAAAAGWPTGSWCTIATSTCAPTIRWCARSKARSG